MEAVTRRGRTAGGHNSAGGEPFGKEGESIELESGRESREVELNVEVGTGVSGGDPTALVALGRRRAVQGWWPLPCARLQGLCVREAVEGTAWWEK